MHLRKAESKDAAMLADMGALTFTHTFGHLYSPEDLHDYITSTYTIEKHLSYIANPRESFWLLEDADGKALGFGWAGACKLPVQNLEHNAGEIKRLYVLPEHQGKKLGSCILEGMLAWLVEQEFGPLYIGVWSQNHGAHRLYKRHGFTHFSEYKFIVGNHRDHEFIFKRATE
ncbi:hypothetical protein BGZ94_000848 [Podila epigama]|nr:hypothetical protein BGZ94_000848 [Podila epigama]